MHGPFVGIEDSQAAVDTWRKQYNTTRPHQSLDMAFPSARFSRASTDVLGLQIQAELGQAAEPADPVSTLTPMPARHWPYRQPADGQAVELDRVVPPSGNLWLAGQQIWLGPAMTGRTVRLWAGLDRVHVLLDGYRVKTLPSRLDARDLARLAAAGPAPPGRRRYPRHRVT